MTIRTTWLSRRKWILATAGFLVLAGLWWAFRPEKLWIDAKVNEPAPFDTNGDPQPILTGRFKGTAQTSGRANIYKKPGGGEYLQLNDFTAPDGPDVHVLLARSDDPSLAQSVVKGDIDGIDIGRLKSNQGDQNYDLPGATDLSKYDAVIIYGERSRGVFGLAKLEPF
jgi:Electron transfer DM13